MRGKEARIAAVIKDYEEGLTVKELAEKHDISVNTVTEYLRQNKMNNASDYHKKKMEQSEQRTEAMSQEYEDGLSMQEIADRHRVDYSRVQQSLQDRRMDGINYDTLYKVLMCPAQSRGYIARWAESQAGRTLRTPDGEMTVAEVYPNIMLCIMRRNKRMWRTTFTSGQLFYMNGGR